VGIELTARLKAHKLLIPRPGKMAKAGEFAQARYTAGTRFTDPKPPAGFGCSVISIAVLESLWAVC